tara:strand:+ start:3654 stop:4535 length:882 start_codon:yes stop_codon:yes gene_type:complete
MKKKILLTGASGKLGSVLITYLKKKYSLYLIGFQKKPKNGNIINLTNSSKVKNYLNKIKPDIILHLVAMTNVDQCEKDFEKAYDLNCKTTINLVNWAYKKKCRLIYISTDQVYDNAGFNSENKAIPKNIYSLTKYISENISLSLPNSVVLRTNFYGFFPKHNDSLINWFLKSIQTKKETKLIKNIFFNPLYVHQLCLYILDIIKNSNIKGIFNLGAKNKISKGELLFKVATKLNLDKKKLKYCNVNKIKLKTFRPKNMLMNVKKIEKQLKKKMPTIDDGINNLIKDIKGNAFG